MIGFISRWLKRRFAATDPVIGDDAAESTEPFVEASHVMPYDENLLERARLQWHLGDWASLAKIDRETLQHHPDRAKLALLAAAAHQQINQQQTAAHFAKLALDWGCNKKLVAQLLIAGVHNTLGRASLIKKDDRRALQHFAAAVKSGSPGMDSDVMTRNRALIESANIGIIQQATQTIDYQPVKSESRLIIVAGIPRSGSTWLYNCIRFILEKEYGDVYACWVDDYVPETPVPVHLVKIHKPNLILASKTQEIYTARRDIREIAGSLMRMKWNKEGDEFLYQLDGIVNDAHKFWAERTCLEVEYKEILSMPVQLIENISVSLGLPQSVQECETIAAKVENLSSGDVLDNLTQLHPDHRATGEISYNDLLGEPLVSAISTRYAEWLKSYGYSL